MGVQWWHWIVLGFFLCLSELLVPAFVLVWLGLAALILGTIMLLIPFSLTAQLFLWAALSAALVFVWLRIFKTSNKTTRAGSSDSFVGETGILVNGIEPFQRGEVMFQRPVLGSDRWSCIADVHLEASSHVRVVAIEGACLKVERSRI